MEEMVDIIDEEGAVIGTVEKREAHEKGLLHKTVIGELIDSEGRWLLVKQAPDRQDPGQYVSPVGGHVSAGETEEEALLREAEEEVGLTGALDFEYVHRAVFNREVIGRKENHLFVMYKIHTDTAPILNHESVGYHAFTEEELSRALKETPELFGGAFHFVVQGFFPHLLSK